jgi:hypothetical protein
MNKSIFSVLFYTTKIEESPTIVFADMALVTQGGWITSAQGFAPITIRTFVQCFDSP